MSGLQLITLDLDNTLWDVDSIIIKAEADMRDWLASHAPDTLAVYESDALPRIRERVFERFQHQAHDLSFMRIQILREVLRRAGYNDTQARRLAKAAFEVFFAGRNRVEFFPGALDMLEALRGRYRLFALTNGNADIHRAGLGEYLHGAFSSADVGVKKPHADMFLAPLKRLDLAPRQAVHVGDHLVDDVSGAHGVGMHSIWVNISAETPDENLPAPTRQVTHLDEVAAAIEEIARA